MSYTGVQKLLWRRQMLHDNEAPKPSEIRNLLGSPLSEIFFNTLDDQGKRVLGLKPEMRGPGRDLWVSPSDLLDGKVKLTVPMTRKYTRALTHKGILEIGNTALDLYEKEKEKEKKQAVIEAERKARIAEMEKCREAIRVAVEEEREKHDKEKEALMEQFHETIQEAMNVTKCRFEDKMKVTVQIERAEVANLMEDKMDFALENQEVELIEQCKTEEMFRLSALNKEYQEFLLENKHKMDKKLQGISDDYNIRIDKMHKKLENEKLSDISNAIKLERDHYATEIKELKKDFDNEITKLNTMLEEKQSGVEMLEALADKASRNMKAWEGKAKLIFHEFQKFINFSMKAVPGQAEYLLSLEKLLAQDLEQQIPDEETENICLSYRKSREDQVADLEIPRRVLSDILHEAYDRTDMTSCTALFSTRAALVKVLQGIYIFNEMNIEEEILHSVIKFAFSSSSIQLENEILITTFNELPRNMLSNDLAYEIKHIIDEYTVKELFIKTLSKMFEISDENPSLDVMNKILDGIYSSEDMYSCKETLTKILKRVYQHLDVLPLKDILKTLLSKVYEVADVYFGRKILLIILNTIYTSEISPEKSDLMKILERIYTYRESELVKSNLIKIITKIHESEILDDYITVTDTYNTVNLKEKICKLFKEASEIKYEHPGKEILIGVLDKVFETNENIYAKESLINIMEKVYQSILVNPSKEILLKIIDCTYNTTESHHTKDILTEVLESITKEDLTHPGKGALLEILQKVKRVISEKSLTKRDEIESVLEDILQDTYKVGDMKGIINEILRKISEEHIHPGREILLEILKKVDLMQPPVKRGDIIYASVEDIITRIIDGINKAENIFSSHDLYNIVYDTLEKETLSKSLEQTEEIHSKSMDIINIIHAVSLQPALSTMDDVIETVFQATENVEKAIKEMKLVWQQENMLKEISNEKTEIATEDTNLDDTLQRAKQLSFKDRGLVGEGGTEHLETSNEFLASRLNSLIRIFRDHVSLSNLVIPPPTLNRS